MSPHVFISYRHGADGAYVEKLANHLSAAGISCWFDRELITGSRWTDVVEAKISTCAAFIVVMTSAAKTSEWVAREIRQADDTHRPILPLLLEGQRFFALNNLQYEDVRDGKMPSPGFVAQLATVIGVAPPSTNGPQPPALPGLEGTLAGHTSRRSPPVASPNPNSWPTDVEPAALPPLNTLADTAVPLPNVDGLYVAALRDYGGHAAVFSPYHDASERMWTYIRFYRDFHVSMVTTAHGAAHVAQWLSRDPHKWQSPRGSGHPVQGSYTYYGGQLTISWIYSRGTEYEFGRLSPDAGRLEIEGGRSPDVYRFLQMPLAD